MPRPKTAPWRIVASNGGDDVDVSVEDGVASVGRPTGAGESDDAKRLDPFDLTGESGVPPELGEVDLPAVDLKPIALHDARHRKLGSRLPAVAAGFADELGEVVEEQRSVNRRKDAALEVAASRHPLDRLGLSEVLSRAGPAG